MVRCALHGLQGGIAACPHVVQAEKGKAPISYYSVKHDKLIGFQLLCDVCLDRWTKISSEADLEVLAGELQLICGVCFNDWSQKEQ